MIRDSGNYLRHNIVMIIREIQEDDQEDGSSLLISTVVMSEAPRPNDKSCLNKYNSPLRLGITRGCYNPTKMCVVGPIQELI